MFRSVFYSNKQKKHYQVSISAFFAFVRGSLLLWLVLSQSSFSSDLVNEEIPYSRQTSSTSCLNSHKELFRVWCPIAIKNVVASSGFITERWVLSQAGQKVMASMVPIETSGGFYLSTGWGLLSSFEILVSQERGRYEAALKRGNLLEANAYADNIGKIYRTGQLMGACLSVPVIMGMYSTASLMSFFGYNPSLCQLTRKYYKVAALATPLAYFGALSESLCLGAGHTNNTILVSGISFLKAIASYLFVLGPLKFEEPIVGLAVASTIGRVATATSYLMIFKCNKDYEKYGLFNSGIDRRAFSECWKYGAPMLARDIMGSIGSLALTYFVLPDSPEALSAWSLTSQLLLPSAFVTSAIAQATNISVTRSKGNNTTAAYAAGNIGIAQGTVITGGLLMAAYLASDTLSALIIDTSDPKNQSMIANYKEILAINLVSSFFQSINDITACALRGIGQPKTESYSNILSFWLVGLPAASLLANYYGLGIAGTCTGLAISAICNSCCLQYFWQRLRHGTRSSRVEIV